MAPLPVTVRSLLGFCVALALIAAEPSVDAGRVKAAREVQVAAAKALDLWTLLQVEAWADAQGVGMRAALPGLSVYGDPLLAAPHQIGEIFDVGDRIMARSQDRIYHWDDDGRPVRTTTPLPYWATAVGYSPDGTYIGCALTIEDMKNDTKPGTLRFSVVDLNGRELWRTEHPGMAREQLWQLVVARDGSALAVVARGRTSGVEGRYERLIVALSGSVRYIDELRRPYAIGPNGNWVAADLAETGRCNLKNANSRRELTAIADGSRCLAVAGERLVEITNDGALQPLEASFGVGPDTVLRSLDGWLAVDTGAQAKSAPGVDLLGNPTPGGEAQPRQVALLRWRELAKDINAMPAMTWLGSLSIDACAGAVVLRPAGQIIERVDLSADEPVIQPLVQLSGPVSSIWPVERRHYVNFVDGHWQVLDLAGVGLWQGALQPLALSPDWILIRGEGEPGERTQTLVHLAADPAARNEVPMPSEPWGVAVDRSGTWGVTWNQHEGWRRFALPDGTINDQGGDPNKRPKTEALDDPHGRLGFAPGRQRLERKDTVEPRPAVHRLVAQDAWRAGRNLLVLGSGHLWINGKKPGDLIDLGSCGKGSEFRLFNGQLVITDGGGAVCATLSSGLKLDTDPASSGETAERLPAGPWRVDGLQYMPPRASGLIWNDSCGIRPWRLRNPDNDTMLVAQGPVVLVLEPAAAKALGKALK